MSDKRPWAKIDAGYMMNRKWFQIERSMRTAMPNALPIALRTAMRLARECHMASILYCVQGSTDGEFPVSAVKSIVGVTEPEEEVAITALFESGMWINHTGGMAEVKDYLEHQTPSDKVRQKSEAGKKGAAVRWGKNANRNANRNAEEKRREENISNSRVLPEGANRTDIQEILDYLDAALKEAEIPLPSRTKTNLTAARLLIDKDGHTVDQVKAAIDFTFQDEFWRTNIRSMSKLREKWVQLRGAAQRKMPQAPQKPAVPDPYAYLEVSPPLTRGGSNG